VLKVRKEVTVGLKTVWREAWSVAATVAETMEVVEVGVRVV